ncbi:MAG: hypothetical protein H0V44_08655 [Planctomycetes bacterium]|nr:hypothetical protein [Planctomycetota bacterium]
MPVFKRCVLFMLLLVIGGANRIPGAEPGSTDDQASDPVEATLSEFRRAFAGDDVTAKRQALSKLADRSVGADDEVLPLLVAVVGDRQAYDSVIAALRQRTGLKPPVFEGQSHYPNYPPSDHPASWRYWLEDRTRERVQEVEVDQVLREAIQAKVAADAAAEAVDAAAARDDDGTDQARTATSTDSSFQP